jgi:antimicrobial peptide system SdpA family protein
MTPVSSIRSVQPARLGVVAILVGVFWSTFVLYVALGALPYNPVRPPLLESLRTQVWMPEGWGFFTRNPREERIFLFSSDHGSWIKAALPPLGQPKYMMGLDRAPRAQGVEMAMLLAAQPLRTSWKHCEGAPTQCLERQETASLKVKNRSPNPSLCGLIGFVKRAPVPWAWSNSPKPVVMPSSTARVEVVC